MRIVGLKDQDLIVAKFILMELQNVSQFVETILKFQQKYVMITINGMWKVVWITALDPFQVGIVQEAA